jgi:hypothetical protein
VPSGLEESTNPSTLISEVEPVVERPRSPWTPSYSVTVQGPGLAKGQPALDGEELDNLEQLPGRALVDNHWDLQSVPSIPDENVSLEAKLVPNLQPAGIVSALDPTTPKSVTLTTFNESTGQDESEEEFTKTTHLDAALPENGATQSTPPAVKGSPIPAEVAAGSDEANASLLNLDRAAVTSPTEPVELVASHLEIPENCQSTDTKASTVPPLPDAVTQKAEVCLSRDVIPSLVAEDHASAISSTSQSEVFPSSAGQGDEVVQKLAISILWYCPTLTVSSQTRARSSDTR